MGHEKAKKILLSLLVDAKVLDIALHHKLDYFITRDKQLLKEAIPLLPIYTPLQFLKEINC